VPLRNSPFSSSNKNELFILETSNPSHNKSPAQCSLSLSLSLSLSTHAESLNTQAEASIKQCTLPRIILQKQKHITKTNTIKKQHLYSVYIAKTTEGEEGEGEEGEEPEEKKHKKHKEKEEESSTVSTTIYS